MSDAIIAHNRSGKEAGLLGNRDKALARVWMAERFSWSLTRLTHSFSDQRAFERRMEPAELDDLARYPALQTAIAENYVGPPV